MKRIFPFIALTAVTVLSVFSCQQEPAEIRVSSISLSKSALELTVGDQASLDATISPDNATNKKISWSSSKESVATVTPEGIVEAVSAGTAFITATSEDLGGKIDDFSSFIYRSLRNVCLSHLRRTKEMCNIDDVPEVEDEVIDTSIRDARIWRAIDELPKKCREIFLMSKRDGLSNSEIAEELDLSVKTVKNQITKAFSRLRDALPDDHKPFFLPFL